VLRRQWPKDTSFQPAVRWRADQRAELEELCRYITRPAIANERLKRNRAGQVVLQLKSPYKDGTAHIVMEPLEFMERLAALVPRPRLHLIRFHGVLAPNAKLRRQIVPAPAERAAAPPADHASAQARRNFIPVAFIPRENPFYCALPYNDVMHGQFKPEAPLVIPWFKQAYTGPGQSVCKGRWVAIRKENRTCYAQWEDCGPFRTDHFQYVFQNERPKPNLNDGAGLDVSPAVRDYLRLQPTDTTDWQFVEARDVPLGPWRSYGENNHFVIARRQTEQRLKEQKEK
jgi:hypothetical protein